MSKIQRQLIEEARVAREEKRAANEARDAHKPAPYDARTVWATKANEITADNVPPASDPKALGAPIPAPGETPWWLKPATQAGHSAPPQSKGGWPFPGILDGDGDPIRKRP